MDRVEAIRPELDKRPEDFDLGALVPLVVPRAFSKTGSWPGPIYELAASGLDQTWAVLGPDDVLRYVSRAMEAYWAKLRLPWKERALNNLRAAAEAQPYSHAFRRDDGSLYMVIMLYPQGLGPARLLVPGLLQEVFPGGYKVAVPEMTCAMAFTLTPSNDEKDKIDDILRGCFESGTEPVSPDKFDPRLFWQFVSEDRGAGTRPDPLSPI
jgi:hypothetical protein